MGWGAQKKLLLLSFSHQLDYFFMSHKSGFLSPPDSPCSIFHFTLLQNRAMRDLIFYIVFHQFSHTKLELVLAFLGFSSVMAVPISSMAPYYLERAFLSCSTVLRAQHGLAPVAPYSTFHILPPQDKAYAPSSLQREQPASSAPKHLCRQD